MVGIEIDSTTIFKTSEQSQSPPSRLGNVTEILKSDFLNLVPTNVKLIFAVPPPLFRGEARVIVLCKTFCKISIFQKTLNQSRTIVHPRPFLYQTKIRNIIKVRNSPATRRLTAVPQCCKSTSPSFPNQDTGRLSTYRIQRPQYSDFRPQYSSRS